MFQKCNKFLLAEKRTKCLFLLTEKMKAGTIQLKRRERGIKTEKNYFWYKKTLKQVGRGLSTNILQGGYHVKKLLLVCAAGMSTSLLVNKMKDAAKEKGLELEIFALPVSECESVASEVDVVLLGPQVRYQKPQVDAIIEGRVPVEVIDMRDYGTMNGKAVLEKALNLIR